jgi:hypothetical protein
MSLSPEAQDLVAFSEKLFSQRGNLLTLWQEISDHFYPERANFTIRREVGDEFADHLTDSYPAMVRRDLGNSISAMLRPTSQDWGEMTIMNEDTLDNESRRWLEWAWARQRQAMYDRAALFTRATKEGDHDFASFGQCVIHVGLTRERTSLLFRSHHLRDTAWCENEDGVIDHVLVKRKLYAKDLVRLFGEKNVHQTVRRKASTTKGAYDEVSCIHMVVPAYRYDVPGNIHKYVSIYIDLDHLHLIEARSSRRLQYVIPRWQTVSGSQYAFSPSTIIALPDARLIQAMTLTLLEAGEKYVNPPLIATHEVVRGDPGLYPGAITWVEQDYDERWGAAIRPLQQDKSSFPYGIEINDRQKEQLREAFYLNQVTGMPKLPKQMTAYEASEHVKNYIRQATPLFEPMESEYNGGLCEETFELLLWAGVYGSPMDIPRMLQGREVEFKFKSPLHDAEEREKGQKFIEATQLIGTSAQIDPTTVVHLDIHQAFRDSLVALDVPSKWVTPEENAVRKIQEMQEAQAMAEGLQAVGGVANVMETAGRAGQEMNRAEASSS